MMDLLTSQTFVGLLQAAGIGFLVLLAALGQWMGKRKETDAPASKDLMIPSVAVADRVALEHLADTLRDATRIARDHREHDADMLYELKAIKESHGRIESMLGRILDHLK